MSAIITNFPGATRTAEDNAEGSALIHVAADSAADADRVAQLVALYKRLGRAPVEAFGRDAVESILRALDEGRDQDAFDLLRIAVEDRDGDDFRDGEEIHLGGGIDSPIPDAAVIWRHLPKKSNKAFSVVGGPASQAAVRLRPQRQMAIDSARNWIVSVGDLEFGPSSHRASVELGLKGDLFVLLLSGSLVVRTSEGRVVAEIACEPGERRLVRVVYCAKRSAKMPVLLQLECVGEEIAQGVWCHSGRSVIAAEQRREDPEYQDTFCTAYFHPITAVTESGDFCEGATSITRGPKYAHRESVLRGDFACFTPACKNLASDETWAIDPAGLGTSVVGMAAVPAAVAHPDGVRGRELAVHPGDIEVMIAAGGISWVAIAAQRRRSRDDDPPELRLSTLEEADGTHTPAFVTPLVTTADGGCDILILKPSFGHTVWMTPGSGSRFLHFMFGDPELVVPKRTRGAADQQRAPAARAGGRS